jgi:hypothetical protein
MTRVEAGKVASCLGIRFGAPLTAQQLQQRLPPNRGALNFLNVLHAERLLLPGSAHPGAPQAMQLVPAAPGQPAQPGDGDARQAVMVRYRWHMLMQMVQQGGPAQPGQQAPRLFPMFPQASEECKRRVSLRTVVYAPAPT